MVKIGSFYGQNDVIGQNFWKVVKNVSIKIISVRFININLVKNVINAMRAMRIMTSMPTPKTKNAITQQIVRHFRNLKSKNASNLSLSLTAIKLKITKVHSHGIVRNCC